MSSRGYYSPMSGPRAVTHRFGGGSGRAAPCPTTGVPAARSWMGLNPLPLVGEWRRGAPGVEARGAWVEACGLETAWTPAAVDALRAVEALSGLAEAAAGIGVLVCPPSRPADLPHAGKAPWLLRELFLPCVRVPARGDRWVQIPPAPGPQTCCVPGALVFGELMRLSQTAVTDSLMEGAAHGGTLRVERQRDA